MTVEQARDLLYGTGSQLDDAAEDAVQQSEAAGAGESDFETDAETSEVAGVQQNGVPGDRDIEDGQDAADSTSTSFDDGTVGLGVDIVEIERMKALLERSPAFMSRVFSADEQAYCNKKASPATHYATRFAAKEAVVKALGTGFSNGIGVRDIEVVRSSSGKPSVVLSGRAREIANELGVRELSISLSYTHAEAVACAMA
ncbi:MAG: holo-ACP synthase, partial [Eggerthellaceae bacterium]|nr:holo-ACP synthase [Eggerthellaceae bacterium]